MAAYTLNTTPAQDRALAWRLVIVNEERARDNRPPFVSIEAWLRADIVAHLQPVIAAFKTYEQERIGAAYLNAPPAAQTQIRTVLGVAD